MAAVADVEAAAEVVVAAEGCEIDRVGLAWRDELAAGIFAHLDRIDLVEVIAEDYFHASQKRLRALRLLADHVPITLHGVAMGLASTIPVAPERIEKMARLVTLLNPDSWSEHLAFVRAGGVEIGHLAASPRTAESVAGAIANIKTAAQVVGSYPILENVATLIDPPASTMDEGQWVSEIIRDTDTFLLLDLHNLYANAINFGEDPKTLLLRFPLDRVKIVHISGGKWISENAEAGSRRLRLLDDHLHDVPDAVHDLLAILAEHAPQPLSVILERDGHFPKFDHLLSQLELARQALRRGRSLAIENRKYA